MESHRARKHRHAAFSLIEVIIVVLILSILAALVVPQFTSADSETRENSTKMNSFRIRQQLELYRQQHTVGYPPLATFAAQMLDSSDADGNTAPPGTPGFRFGPYLRSIPENPFTGSNTVGGDFTPGTSDWYYDQASGNFRANSDAAHQGW